MDDFDRYDDEDLAKLVERFCFDKTDLYMEKINPLVEQLFELCRKYELPAMFFCVHGTSVAKDKYETQAGTGLVGNPDHVTPQMWVAYKMLHSEMTKEIVEVAAEIRKEMVAEAEAREFLRELTEALKQQRPGDTISPN